MKIKGTDTAICAARVGAGAGRGGVGERCLQACAVFWQKCADKARPTARAGDEGGEAG